MLGAPLYLVNEDWYNAWIAFTKQSIALLITTLTQTWAPTLVRVSGDRSVQGQLSQTSEGNLMCKFPSRLILMSNHQVCVPGIHPTVGDSCFSRSIRTGYISGG